MRLRNVKNAATIVSSHPLVITEINSATFTNEKPIRIEIGMGKGDFIIEMSKAYPEFNFVGIEKYPSVMVRALEKAEELPNLRFLCLDAKEINEVVKIKIDAIYLNFSDPWPKKRHAKRRLTSKEFLAKYALLFENEINIYQKTDNKAFFADSVVSLSANGYTIKDLSLDLTNSEIPNIQTEYEKKFVSLGETINYCHATKKI